MNKIPRLILALIFISSLSIQSCHSKNETKNNSLNGKWAIEFISNDIGDVRSFLTFEFTDTSFIAYTRKGADRDILGFWKSLLGRIFTKDFKNGSLINITNGKVIEQKDSLLLSGIFMSALGNYYFKGSIFGGQLQATLTDGKKNNRGTIQGSKTLPRTPLSDYPALVKRSIELTKENIYNPALLEKGEWEKFDRSITTVSEKIEDDIEMEFAFFYFAGKLPVSHYSLVRQGIKKEEEKHEKASHQIILKEKTAETLYMKIKSFSGTASEMDSVFSIISAKGYKNLIVDLRDNPGGTVEAGMEFATHVVDSTFYGGVFLTKKWFEKNKRIPSIGDYANFPHFTEANFDLILEGVHNKEGICLKVIPAKNPYKGKLFILTNGSTASTCEPIVYALKQHKKAIIVGEKTAGAMLNGEFFSITDGFSMIIPTADYYTSDGFRIDTKGVNPTIITDQEKALDFVMDHFIKN